MSAARPLSARRAHPVVVVLALLGLALPLLAALLAGGAGELPHETQARHAPTHELSSAALDRLERWLGGHLDVLLADLGPGRLSPPSRSGLVAAPSARGAQAALPAPGEREQRL